MSKSIVICCDGSGNEYGRNNTNVVLFYDMALKNSNQCVYYDPGVGTGDWHYDQTSNTLKSMADLATGYGLQKNVEEAYRYLMWMHNPGDRIFLAGFSRGAFTVRGLAGMLKKVGLLRMFDLNQLEYASKIYNTPDNDDIAQGFKQTFCRPCPVHFIGVWDTVESLALNAGKLFYNKELDPSIPYAYHALAIDEQRADFKPCLWDESNKPNTQIIEQVWFPGVHSDIGGYYSERELADITIKWMIPKAIAAGYIVDREKFSKLLSKPDDPNGMMHNEYSGIWRIRGKITREIPPLSKVHKSAIDRKNYNPVNIPSDAEIVS